MLIRYKKASSKPAVLKVLWVKDYVVGALIWREDSALGIQYWAVYFHNQNRITSFGQ